MRLDTIVPNFQADTTHGPIEFYNWQGDSWVFLFSHPADFTPICTSELGHVAGNLQEFTNRNVKCLAHSVDDLRSHVIWSYDIKHFCNDKSARFPYPIIADPQRDLAVAFGMMDDEERLDPEIGYITYQTVRALYLIDPNHKLRLSMFYPMSTGRNMNEVLRCIDSLQLVDRLKTIATPTDWIPGSEILIHPCVSDEMAKKQFADEIKTIAMPSGRHHIRTTKNYL